MQNKTYSDNQKARFLAEWETVSKCGKPIIAAVNGFAVITLGDNFIISYKQYVALKYSLVTGNIGRP